MSKMDQEIVIICGGAAKPAVKNIKKLLNKAKSVAFIGVDMGSLALIKAGYELDYAIGDFDSVNAKEFNQIQTHTREVITYPSSKDDTDMELALLKAQEAYPNSQCYILGGIGEKKGRLDHMLANLWMVYQPRFARSISKLCFIERNHTFQFFTGGEYYISALPPVDYLSIIALTPVDNLRIEQAAYNLPETTIHYPRALISNEFIDHSTPVKLSFSRGIVLIMRVNEIRS